MPYTQSIVNTSSTFNLGTGQRFQKIMGTYSCNKYGDYFLRRSNLLLVLKRIAANALTPKNIIFFRITKNVMGACESVRLCFIVVRIVASFFKNPVLNYLEKATPTHPSPKDTTGISCFGVIEQMKLNA